MCLDWTNQYDSHEAELARLHTCINLTICYQNIELALEAKLTDTYTNNIFLSNTHTHTLIDFSCAKRKWKPKALERFLHIQFLYGTHVYFEHNYWIILWKQRSIYVHLPRLAMTCQIWIFMIIWNIYFLHQNGEYLYCFMFIFDYFTRTSFLCMFLFFFEGRGRGGVCFVYRHLINLNPYITVSIWTN